MDLMNNGYIMFWVCLVGLCLGSFYNVVILRTLSDESIVYPPSKCPKCGERLKPWHNIPVLSYLFLKGKCAFCKEKISIQYPLVELVTMFLFALSYWKFGLTWQALFVVVFLSAMLVMTMTDLKEKLVDCNIAIVLAILGFLYNGFLNDLWVDSILGLLLGVIIMEIVARSGYLVVKDRAFGEADTYVAGALGACFGVVGLLNVLVYSLIASMLFVIPMFLYKQFKQNNKLVCILFILFTLSALFFKTVVQNYLTLALLVVLGLALCFVIIKDMRQNETTLTYLPLVPAFMLGSLYFLFV